MSARRKFINAVAGLALTVSAANGAGKPALPSSGIPLPSPRPEQNAPPEATMSGERSGMLSPYAGGQKNAAVEGLADWMRDRVEVSDVAELKKGLDAIAAGDIAGALDARDAIADRPLDHEILSWAIALAGGLPARDLLSAERELAGWPGMEALKRNIERALYREKADPQTVKTALAGKRPETFEGVVALARAELATGTQDAARALVSEFWRTARLEAKEEAAFLDEFAPLLSTADHRFRMERMLYAERANAALRIADRAGARELATAWAAMIRRSRNTAVLLEAVPAGQRSAGFAFAKAKYLRAKKDYKQAAKVVLAAPRDETSVVDPDAWWIERRVLSRELMDIGDLGGAYRLAAEHAAESPTMAADAEFHAGWYALSGLKDPQKAATHFQRVADVSRGSISLARAYYWLGRAAEAAGASKNARSHYEMAARYGAAFYGQLAAAKLGLHSIPISDPTPAPAERIAFEQREAVRAIGRLEAAGYQARADALYRDLAGELTSSGELALLAAMAERRGDHHLALRIGKIAAARGIDVGTLSHPVGAIPSSAQISNARQALAYAVARQESEFNVSAVSSAGARGLLQLLPRTAKAMAQQVGLGYFPQRLTTDPGYNAALGAAYLDDQLDRFDGSYILTFAGYNAGPARAQEWVGRYGDPRGKNVDAIVDWIERIPYPETRNYVQRVMENLQVYKMRLTGRFDIAADLAK